MMSSRRLWGRQGDAGDDAWTQPTSRVAAGLLLLILLAAAMLRLHGLLHDLPYSYLGDEWQFISRAMAMGTGDLNPHRFTKPALLTYLLLFAYGTFFTLGWLLGQFASPEAFGVYFLADGGPFLLIGRLIVFAFGVAAVYATYLVARRAFGDLAGALGAALVAAALLPMVVGSYVVKADLPASFFVALSVWAYLGTRDDSGWRPVLLAGAFAGLAMGTKYYGVIVLPVFALAELARPFTAAGTPWPRVVLRGALLGLAFVVAFFVVSPYNFLDPTFATRIFGTLGDFVTDGGATRIDPDSRLMYERTFAEIPAAVAYAFGQILRWDALTWPLAALAGLGILGTLARRETRWAACVVAGPSLVFLLAAGTVGAYHTNARHLNAVYPLLVAFVFPGALLATSPLGLREQRTARMAAAALVLLAAAPTAYLTVQENMHRMRMDSRTAAVEWIKANLPREELILLDEMGGIELSPNETAVTRLRARLEELKPDAPSAFDAFTGPEARRLALLEQHPLVDGFNVERLGHPWWLPREMTQAELLSDPSNWHASNPLVNRLPKTLDAYRAEGVRYLVTNAKARRRYEEAPNADERYPSFVRFYDALAQLEPLKVFDPAEWHGKGPVVRIYDLRRTIDAASPAAPPA